MTTTSGKSSIFLRKINISEKSSAIQTWRTSRYPSCLNFFFFLNNHYPDSSLVCLYTATTLSVKHRLSKISITQQGKLAKELDFVSHHVRTKLDELKRQEVNRLRTLIKAKQDLEGGNGMSWNKMCLGLNDL